MGYTKLKLVSMRLPEELLSKIDEFAAKRKYMTRTRVISDILQNVWDCADDITIWRMIETWDAYSSGYTIHFTKNK